MSKTFYTCIIKAVMVMFVINNNIIYGVGGRGRKLEQNFKTYNTDKLQTYKMTSKYLDMHLILWSRGIKGMGGKKSQNNFKFVFIYYI